MSTKRKNHAASCSTVGPSPATREPMLGFTGWNPADVVLWMLQNTDQTLQDMVRAANPLGTRSAWSGSRVRARLSGGRG